MHVKCMLLQNPHLTLRYWITLLTIAFLSRTKNNKHLNLTNSTALTQHLNFDRDKIRTYSDIK